MNSEEKKRLGQRVREARKALRITQQELADKAHVSLGVINNLETGKTVPQGGNRQAIAKALAADVFEDGIAQSTRDLWPNDVVVFTDVLGLYLANLPEDERAQVVSKWMNEIVTSRVG